jgi:hypothetical protein
MCKNINLGNNVLLYLTPVPGFSLTCIPPILINVGGWDLKMDHLILFLSFLSKSTHTILSA